MNKWQKLLLLEEPHLDCYVDSSGNLLIEKTDEESRLRTEQIIEKIISAKNKKPLLIRTTFPKIGKYAKRKEVILCLIHRNYT